MLRALLGNLPYSGSIQEDGIEIYGNHDREVSFVPQRPTIPDGMRLFEFVGLVISVRSGRIDRSKVLDVLQKVSLIGRVNSPVTELSGGEIQRALIARTLLQKPNLHLLDEPTSALDLHHQVELMNLFESMKSAGSTIVSTTHDISLATLYADQLIVMKSGSVLISGPTQSVIHSRTFTDAYEGNISVHTLESGRTVVVADKD